MRILVRGFLATLLLSGSALAASSGDLAIYGGQFSAFRDNKERSTEFGMEYRYRDIGYGIRPTVGGLTNTDGATMGYAGINWDLPLGIAPFYITPGVKIGGYDKGSSKDLGNGVEFRDSIEVTYRFQDGQRVGASLAHISNAGLGSENPGVEMIEAVYSHPL